MAHLRCQPCYPAIALAFLPWRRASHRGRCHTPIPRSDLGIRPIERDGLILCSPIHPDGRQETSVPITISHITSNAQRMQVSCPDSGGSARGQPGRRGNDGSPRRPYLRHDRIDSGGTQCRDRFRCCRRRTRAGIRGAAGTGRSGSAPALACGREDVNEQDLTTDHTDITGRILIFATDLHR
jgi:hypothetical protein